MVINSKLTENNFNDSVASSLCQALKNFQSDELQGYYITKIEVIQSVDSLENKILFRKIRGQELAIIICKLNTHKSLEVWLMKPSSNNEQYLNETAVINKHNLDFYTFSKEEVLLFQRLSGDNNSIHLTQKPVVQGLLQLWLIEQKTTLNEFTIKFQEKLWANEVLYLWHEKQKIIGLNEQNNQVFELLLHNKLF